jgi:hypothetical protein
MAKKTPPFSRAVAIRYIAELGIPTAVVMKSTIFWDMPNKISAREHVAELAGFSWLIRR